MVCVKIMFNGYNLQGGKNFYRHTCQKRLSQTCRRVVRMSESLGSTVGNHPFVMTERTAHEPHWSYRE